MGFVVFKTDSIVMRQHRCSELSFLSQFSWLVIITLLLLSAIFHESHAQCYTKLTGIDTLIDKTVHLFHQEQYDSALQICSHIIDKYPDNPMGYFGASVIYYGIMRNYWSREFESEFDSLITISVQRSEDALKTNPDDAECYFLYGACLGFRGLYRMKRGDWFIAFLDGLNGYRNLKKAFQRDSTLYDVYYGLGVFYYFKSVKAKALTFLRLMKDERQKGIDYVKIAIQNGRFAPLEGQFELIKIYYYEKRYSEALAECRRIEHQFSNNAGWIYLMAKILAQHKKWDESAYYFNKLITKLNTSPYQIGNSLRVDCHYGLAISAYHLHAKPNALEESKLALIYAHQYEKDEENISSIVNFDDILKELKIFNEHLKKSMRK